MDALEGPKVLLLAKVKNDSGKIGIFVFNMTLMDLKYGHDLTEKSYDRNEVLRYTPYLRILAILLYMRSNFNKRVRLEYSVH